MIEGRFGDTTGRPYVEGRLTFPRMNIISQISFLVDTGADHSLLHPIDGIRMKLDYSQLTGSAESVGIGGVCHNWVEEAYIAFTEPSKCIYVYSIQIEIAELTTDNMDIPSLLGRDILDRWHMTYNPSKKSLLFEVVSADIVLPLAK